MKNMGLLYLVGFSLLAGMGGYFVKLTEGISSQQILFARAVVACIGFLIYAAVTGKLKELKLKLPLITILMGATQGLSIYFYYRALETTTITNTTLLVYMAPIFSVILSSLFLKETIAKKTIWGILASLAGVVVVSEPAKLALGSENLIGSIYALLGGFFYSAMAISSKSVTEKTTPIYAAFWQYMVILLLSMPFALPISTGAVTGNLLSIGYLGIVAGTLAFTLYMNGVKLVKGQVIQVITMLEIVVASLSGILLLGEKITMTTVVGGALILAGIWIVSGKSKK